MKTDQPVSHPPVSHPEMPPATDAAVVPAADPSDSNAPAASKASSTGKRPKSRSWRVPPPKVIVAALLVAAAAELLLWQVAGVFWGILVHAVLAGLVLAILAGMFVWRRRARQRRASGRAAMKQGGAGGQRQPRTPLGRLLGRPAAAGGGRPGGGRGLLGKLTGGRQRAGQAGRGGAGLGAGRRGGLLGRLGLAGSSRKPGGAGAGRTVGSVAGRRAGSGSALGRLRAGGRRLLGQGRPAAAGRASPVGASPARRAFGLLGGKRQNTSAKRKPARSGMLADFMKGFRDGAKGTPAPERRKPSPGPDRQSSQAKPDKPAQPEKPQPPTNEQLVKEAVEKVADAEPAVAAPQHRGASDMSNMNKIRAAAEEFAAALREYDPEDMHQMVREMPQFGEALNDIQQGFRQIASRAESEWPVATPVAEGLRSIADDIKAGAGTAEEARGTVRRENETDIERGEAPRHGSIHVERKWNV